MREESQTGSSPNPCSECGKSVPDRPTFVEYEGEEIFLFDPTFCSDCLLKLCQHHSVVCANCGGKIPPYSMVGVLKADDGERQYVHMTTRCTSVGSAFHGYLGKGTLGQFVQVEAC